MIKFIVFNFNQVKKSYDIKAKKIAYIGANEGQEVEDLVSTFNNSEIHLFEPQAEPFEKLIKKYDNWENLNFYNFGLGSEKKEVELYVNSNNNNMSSSVLKPKEHLRYHPGVEFGGKELIKIQKFSNLNIQDINFLNLDVQGYELEVLKGFEDYLMDVDYIICEVNRKELYENCVLVGELDKYLKGYNLIRVQTKWYEKTIPWGDAFYIRKSEISIGTIIFATIKNFITNIRGYFFTLSILKKINLI
jgi:FkbM family methyltransferase